MTDTITDPLITTDAAVTFTDVSMTFPDGTHALARTSFAVAAGEFVTVVGPSGCGKSTLLRIASGLTTPTTGSVNVDKSSLGYVFQDATLLPFEKLLQLDRVDTGHRNVCTNAVHHKSEQQKDEAATQITVLVCFCRKSRASSHLHQS